MNIIQSKGTVLLGAYVRDTISYAGDVILTIYHKGFDSEIGHRKIKRVEKVGRYNIIFEEKVVELVNKNEIFFFNGIKQFVDAIVISEYFQFSI